MDVAHRQEVHTRHRRYRNIRLISKERGWMSRYSRQILILVVPKEGKERRWSDLKSLQARCLIPPRSSVTTLRWLLLLPPVFCILGKIILCSLISVRRTYRKLYQMLRVASQWSVAVKRLGERNNQQDWSKSLFFIQCYVHAVREEVFERWCEESLLKVYQLLTRHNYSILHIHICFHSREKADSIIYLRGLENENS